MLLESAEQPAEQLHAARYAQHAGHLAFPLDRNKRSAQLAQIGGEIPAPCHARQQAEHAEARGAADREEKNVAACAFADIIGRQNTDRRLAHVTEPDNDRLRRQASRI